MRRWLFLFFLVSGFCGLVYEVVWIRLAMAAFGVTTPFISIVLSVFMGGLALGSVAGGSLARRGEAAGPGRDLRLYALAEAVIGASGVLVPRALDLGRSLLERWQGDAPWSGPFYLAVSGAWIALVLLPPCACMGATYPLAMAALRKVRSPEDTFSRLYVANVLGATTGTLAAAFVLIETFGFRTTILLAAALNAALVLGALALAAASPKETWASPIAAPGLAPSVRPERSLLGLLFATGLLSMGMEVVWVRQFTPFMGTFVYAFALILATYLAATFLGSLLYRLLAARGASGSWAVAWLLAGTFALLPLLAGDPKVGLPWGLPAAAYRPLLGAAPVSAAFGFLTPMLVDRWSGGVPERAGAAYAVNVVGCILGPLLACFLLLPWFGERLTTVLLAAPLFLVALQGLLRRGRSPWPALAGFAACAAASALLVGKTHAYETRFESCVIRRDSTATAIAVGSGRSRDLFVNGVSVTGLTPITKVMVHLPMAWREPAPRNVLVICFGMGTSFRSALSWGVPCTSVELVPSVAELFPYFHDDARAWLAAPGARIVVDDGRRFLERTSETFDLVVIDPPPPVEAAASSLLYSREFYVVLKRRLSEDGILQQWLPDADTVTLAAIVRALQAEFPHVRGFKSVDGGPGVHFLASRAPLANVTAADLARRLPPAAAKDLVEWGPEPTPIRQLGVVLDREVRLDLGRLAPNIGPLVDDRPVNEYFLLRRFLRPRTQRPN